MKLDPDDHSVEKAPLEIIDLGRISYAQAYQEQVAWRDRLIHARNAAQADAAPTGLPAQRVYMLEHDPAVITMTRRQGIAEHLLANPSTLKTLGIEVVTTDRGGDITYHGPGQLVAYAILDLQRLGLGVREYMHSLEEIVIDTLAEFDIAGKRDAEAVGVWVDQPGGGVAKICALGVRIRKWVTMHGLALNVEPDLRHFDTIVPCGLAGRSVTSMAEVLQKKNARPPNLDEVKQVISDRFQAFVVSRLREHR